MVGNANGADFYRQTIKTALIVELEASYHVAEPLTVSIGANNLFNKRPPTLALVPGTTNFTLVNSGNVVDAPLTFSPNGITGGGYLLRPRQCELLACARAGATLPPVISGG